jgi:single-stranded-DNA-specific exonuclease
MNLAGSSERPFLGVERSALGNVWRDRLDARARLVAEAIAQKTALPELIARILAGRGVEAEAAASFLSPSIRELMPDPDRLTGMAAAANRLVQAIGRGERVAIFGDYDVDGAASSALLSRFLAAFSAPHEIHIPDRVFEGYGPNEAAIDALAARGARLLVTVDCGATSMAALAHARAIGLDAIVLDHHLMGEEIPPAVAVVNPNRQDDLSGLGHLSATGIVFMALVAVARILRGQGRSPPDLMASLDLVALATVCDVVPLAGLNRAFVVRGLEAMRARANLGLAELARVARLDGPPRPWHLGFLFGPRINAGGRIGDAALGARLLTTNDPAEARAIAEQLEALNVERQALEARALEQAVAEAEAEIAGGGGPAVLVVGHPQWSPGIVGLVAARLKERYHRPAVAIAFDGQGKGTGSGRSISGVDLGHSVRAALTQGILEKGGGHAMAAGLTVRREKLADLRAHFEEGLGAAVRKRMADRQLRIDGALSARAATAEFCDLVERAGPYGQGHPGPVFAFPSHGVRNARQVGRDAVSFALRAADGAMLRAIAFRAAGSPLGKLLLNAPPALHVAGSLSAEWRQGTRRVELRVIDAAMPE